MIIGKAVKVCALLLVVLGLGACQPPPRNNPTVQVEGAHIKALAPGQTRAAAYFILHNHGQQDLQMLHVEAQVAAEAQVHRHIHENGLMKMRQVRHLLVPAGAKLVFEPGGYHLMLLDISEPPAVGSQFTVTMEFDGADKLSFPVEVRPH